MPCVTNWAILMERPPFSVGCGLIIGNNNVPCSQTGRLVLFSRFWFFTRHVEYREFSAANSIFKTQEYERAFRIRDLRSRVSRAKRGSSRRHLQAGDVCGDRWLSSRDLPPVTQLKRLHPVNISEAKWNLLRALLVKWSDDRENWSSSWSRCFIKACKQCVSRHASNRSQIINEPEIRECNVFQLECVPKIFCLPLLCFPILAGETRIKGKEKIKIQSW